MKREELESPVVNEYYGECEWESFPDKYYYKDEADKVMDAMEARIKELEEANKLAVIAGNKQAGRIKELEATISILENNHKEK